MPCGVQLLRAICISFLEHCPGAHLSSSISGSFHCNTFTSFLNFFTRLSLSLSSLSPFSAFCSILIVKRLFLKQNLLNFSLQFYCVISLNAYYLKKIFPGPSLFRLLANLILTGAKLVVINIW